MVRYLFALAIITLFTCSAFTEQPEEIIYKGNIWNFTTASETELVAYYPMDEGSGIVVKDTTGNGHDGTIQGGADWVQSMTDLGMALDFTNKSYVDTGNWYPSRDGKPFSVLAWINWAGSNGGWQGIVSQTTGQGYGNSVFQFALHNTNGLGVGGGNIPQCFNSFPPEGQWTHVAFSFDGTAATVYMDGKKIGTTNNYVVKTLDNANVRIGTSIIVPTLICPFNGVIDEVYIYNGVLSQAEIQQVMEDAFLIIPGTASISYPPNKATDVQSDVILSWKPGQYTYTHNVFFGTDFNDVKNATIDNPLGVTVSEGQAKDANTFDPGILEYGQTYYWRVEEVNAPSTPGSYKGQVWQFTTEPYTYKIPGDKIIATAISSYRGNYPNSTVNESGLNPNNMDLHSSNSSNMWHSSGQDTEPVWIRYDFDKTYKLDEMLVWNYNGLSSSGYGFKNVIIGYTEDGNNWNVVSDVNVFAQAPGTGGYKYNTIVDFNGVLAKSVKITAFSNWSNSSLNYYGLSEIRFMYIPTFSRSPVPMSGAINVPRNITLRWRPGRGASEHNVYVGTDEQVVINGTVSKNTVTEPNYGPLSLVLDTNYYWRVDEINDSESHSVWPGEIWNFTTMKYIVVDDFEDYNDTVPNRICDFYTDGRNDPLNGSIIGYPDPNLSAGEHYMERSIFHTGFQSVPLSYDNTVSSYSEVSIDSNSLTIGSNWTIGNPEFLFLWFYGDLNNSLNERMYVSINGVKIAYNGNQADILSPIWHKWNIDLASFGINLGNVTSFSLGFERIEETGGSGIIFVDDIRLYRNEPEGDI